VIVPAIGGETHPRMIRHARTGIELLFVRAGSFELGSTDADPGHASDESPARTVELSAFYVARTETTLAEWTRGGGDAGRGAGPEHPVVDVTFGEVDAWCRANGLLLPTEAQWEYAASGPENRIFPWGDADEPFRANALGTVGADRWDDTAPVGSFPRGASWCSAYDLAGNAAEWCRDVWHPSSADLPEGPTPVRADGEGTRVVRGGSFSCRPPYCLRTAYRDGIDPALKGGNLGFRVVLEPQP
jgi:formylglycine-generating enzyme required for sulfatase activity